MNAGPDDLRGRTKAFASGIVHLFIALPRERTEVFILGRQMLKSGTSVAAQYREAYRARSDAEFISKIEAATQEADESMLWMELLRDDCGIKFEELERLLAEIDKLIAILTTMVRNIKQRRQG